MHGDCAIMLSLSSRHNFAFQSESAASWDQLVAEVVRLSYVLYGVCELAAIVQFMNQLLLNDSDKLEQ